MFNISKDTTNYKVDDTIRVMQEDTDKYGVFIDIENAYYNFYWYSNIRTRAMKFLQSRGFQLKVDMSGESIKPSDVVDYAIRNKFNAYLGQTAQGRVSLSEESISNFLANIDSYNLENSNDIKLVMKAYLEYKDSSYLISSINGDSNNYLRINKSQFLSNDLHSMGVVRPKYSAQNTGRISAANPSLAGISNKLVKPIVTAPEGYALVNIDMGQVDPREFANLILKDTMIDKLIQLYNDAYFGFLHYCTMSDLERNSGEITKREITDELKKQRDKIKTMTNATIYGKNITDTDEISVAFKNRLSNHPNRVKLMNECKAKLDAGETIFYTLLGTPIDVTKTDDRSIEKHGADDLQGARLRKAVNAQIQGLTADVLRYAYMTIRDYLKENAPSSMIVAQVYDSLKIIVSENDIPAIKDYINQCLAFRIDGCNIPINCEAEWIYGKGKREEFVSNV